MKETRTGMKETRSRSCHNVVIRSLVSGDKKYIEGLIPYNSRSVPIWGMTEIIEKGAFKRALSGESATLALFDHDDSRVLGSTASKTLTLEDSDAGLRCKCELPNTTYANDLFEIVSRGDVQTMSFGFIPEKWEVDADGKVRTLKDVHLMEVSFGVPFPAYPDTESQALTRGGRKLFNRSINVDSINALLEKDTLTDDDKAQVEELIRMLQELIGKGEEKPKDEPPPDSENRAAKEKEALALIGIAIELATDMEENNGKI